MLIVKKESVFHKSDKNGANSFLLKDLLFSEIVNAKYIPKKTIFLHFSYDPLLISGFYGNQNRDKIQISNKTRGCVRVLMKYAKR